jgi:hypothetical protein
MPESIPNTLQNMLSFDRHLCYGKDLVKLIHLYINPIYDTYVELRILVLDDMQAHTILD